jgi:hypothetical protein
MRLEGRPDLSQRQALSYHLIGGGQQNTCHAHRPFDGLSERLAVDHIEGVRRSICEPERPVVAPHRTEVGFSETVPPRRWIRQVKVVSLDDGMHNPPPSKNVVQFISYSALA